MECPRCQASNSADAVFCEECGTRLEATCPSCGEWTRLTAKFCKRCGEPMVQIGVATLAFSARFSSPNTYTPKHLAERILGSRSTMEGQRKQVTVLFADIKGSTELIEGLDPEQAVKRLEPALRAMIDAVHCYEGTVNRVQGDGIMALFGAPLAHEDHAVRASYAALAMQDALKPLARDELSIRVGLNSGEVLVRAIRNDLAIEYEADGVTVHLAARMEQLAEPGTIRLTAWTYQLTEGFLAARALGPTAVKGVGEPIEIFELTGSTAVRTRWQARAVRGLTQFVGREREIESLARALTQAGAGDAQVVAVVGNPGIGKSRLVHEFLGSDIVKDWTVLQTEASPHGRNTAFRSVSNLLRVWFEIEDRDSQTDITKKVQHKIASIDKRSLPNLPAVYSLLDLPVEDKDWQRLDPPQRRRRIIDTLKALILRACERDPLLLVFEDVHWIDAESQSFLENLVDSLGAAKLLLVVTYRPEFQHHWAAKSYYAPIRLDPLQHGSVGQLLRSLIGDDTSLDRLNQLLIERTEGTPLFIEEMVRALVESQTLEGEPGNHRLIKHIDEIEIPATVQSVLAARIDRLLGAQKDLLQVASVIGKDVPVALLRPIAGLPEESLRRILMELQTAEFLYETRLTPDLEYTFKHALTHEVAYGELLEQRRRALHAQIVQAIERLYPDRLIEHVDRLAYHALTGEVWDKAVTYLHQAGEKAFARSANRESATYIEKALGALQHLPESNDRIAQTIDLRLELRNALWPLGELSRILDTLLEADTLSRALDDQHRLGRVSSYLAQHYWMTGDPTRATEFGQRALAIAREQGDFALQIETSLRVGQAYHALGDYHRAKEILTSNVKSLKGELLYKRFGVPGLASITSRCVLSWCLAELGEFTEGISRGEEGVRIADTVDQPYSRIVACLGVSLPYLYKGELQQAIDSLEQGLALCQVANIALWFPRVAAALGLAHTLSGRVAVGVPFLEQAVERAGSMEVKAWQPLLVAWLSEAYLLTDRIDEAGRLARRALMLSRKRAERGNEGWVLRLLGKIALHQDPPAVDKAGAYLHQGCALARELGMRPLLAHCHCGLGQVYGGTENLTKAGEHLGKAVKLFRQMDMRHWLKNAEQELREAEQ